MFLLPLGALSLASMVITARLVPESTRLERLCASATVFLGSGIGLVYALSALHAVTAGDWTIGTCAVLVLALVLGGTPALALMHADALALLRGLRALRDEPLGFVAVGIAAAALGLAVWSAYLLVPWAWDSVGYHLPIVYDAIQERTIRRVPTSVTYVNCYPRLCDVFFIAFRLSLEDETFVELAQVPFLGLAVASIASLAERGGASLPRASSLACLWVGMPVVMLELATAYVDVAVGALVLGSFALVAAARTPAMFAIAGLAIGMLLGSKPSAPPIAAVAMFALLATGWRQRQLGAALMGDSIAASVGVWKYIENIVLWGNPIWPADGKIGPFYLPGKASMTELANSGVREPYLSMSVPRRVYESWITWPTEYVYDMRIGGFGPLFQFVLLPGTIAALIACTMDRNFRRRVRPVLLPVLLITFVCLASPGAFWARYTIAIPGVLLVLLIASTETLPTAARRVSEAVAIACSIVGIVLAYPGFADSKHTLFDLSRLSSDERLAAFALDEQEPEWERARRLIGQGEAFAYDWSFGLPARLWTRGGRVEFLDAAALPYDQLRDFAIRKNVRAIVLGEGPTGSADLAREHPELFRELFRSKYPDWQPCAVFEVVR